MSKSKMIFSFCFSIIACNYIITAQVIYPLSVGSKWNIRETKYDTSDIPTSNFTFQTQIYRDTIISNERWFTADNQGVFWYSNRLDGLYSFDHDQQPFMFYKYPAAKGDSYIRLDDSIFIKSVDSMVSVPAGNFSCILYQIINRKTKYIYAEDFVSPNVGGVRTKQYYRSLEGLLFAYTSDDLESYNIVTKVDLTMGQNVSYYLMQNYPNPFNSSTKISFSLPISSQVFLKIYDANGREVVDLLNSIQSPGEHTVNWDATNYASGVYYYSIQINSFKQTNKLILLR